MKYLSFTKILWANYYSPIEQSVSFNFSKLRPLHLICWRLQNLTIQVLFCIDLLTSSQIPVLPEPWGQMLTLQAGEDDISQIIPPANAMLCDKRKGSASAGQRWGKVLPWAGLKPSELWRKRRSCFGAEEGKNLPGGRPRTHRDTAVRGHMWGWGLKSKGDGDQCDKKLANLDALGIDIYYTSQHPQTGDLGSKWKYGLWTRPWK